MKRLFWVFFFGLFGVFSLCAEFRIDTGLGLLCYDIPDDRKRDGALVDGHFFPLPELGFYGQFNFGNFHAGTGLRGFSYILYSVFWPAVYGEYDLSRVTFHVQIGGGLYGVISLLGLDSAFFGDYRGDLAAESNVVNFTAMANPTIIPEISIWYRFGKFFKVGGGWVSIILLDSSAKKIIDLTPLFYVGLKMTFPSAASRKRPDGTQRLF
jgi:hypothetical protein